MQFVWKYIDDLVGKGFDWHIIARLLFYASSTFVPLALPLAVLLSSLMTFGNLGERYEIVALKASGISIKTIIKPMVIFIAILSFIAFLFSNNVMPVANLKMRTLLHDVRQQKPAVSIQPGIFYDEIENYTIKINKKGNDGKTIEDVVIYDHSMQQGNVSVTVADSGTMQVTKDKRFLVLRLFNGKNYMERIKNREDKISRPLQITEFKEEIRRIDLSSFSFQQTNEEFYRDHYQMMNISQLNKSEDSLKNKISERQVKFDSTYIMQFHYYQNAKLDSNTNIKKTDQKISKKSRAITYSRLSNIFSSTPGMNISSKKKPQNKTGTSIEEHNRARRSEKVHKFNKKKESTAVPPSDLRMNTKGYSLAELRDIADNKGYDLDSLMEHSPAFPTLITHNTKLDTNLLSNFKPREQKKITEYALNTVRNVINRVDYTDNVIDRMDELIARHNIEWHRKFTLPFACIVLFFIGAPLGAIIRKGGFGFPVVVSVLLFVIYHVISMTGEKFAEETVIESWWGMWISAVILLPVGIFLTLKATTDSPLLQSNTYVKFIKRIRNQLGINDK